MQLPRLDRWCVCCSTLITAEGVAVSPDLQEVPQGFRVSGCGRYLLRPNGKPVPRGVHVGPGFRLLKPSGRALPDGEPQAALLLACCCFTVVPMHTTDGRCP